MQSRYQTGYGFEEQIRGGRCTGEYFRGGGDFSQHQEFDHGGDGFFRQQIRILWSHRHDPDFKYYQQQTRRNLYGGVYEEDSRPPLQTHSYPYQQANRYNNTINPYPHPYPYPYPYSTTPTTYPSQVNTYPYWQSNTHHTVNPIAMPPCRPTNQQPLRRAPPVRQDVATKDGWFQTQEVRQSTTYDDLKYGDLKNQIRRQTVTTEFEIKAQEGEEELKAAVVEDLIQLQLGVNGVGLKETTHGEKGQGEVVKTQGDEAQNELLGRNVRVEDTGQEKPIGALTQPHYLGSEIHTALTSTLPKPVASTIAHQPWTMAAAVVIGLSSTVVEVGDPRSTVAGDAGRSAGRSLASRFPKTGIGDSPSISRSRVEATADEVGGKDQVVTSAGTTALQLTDQFCTQPIHHTIGSMSTVAEEIHHLVSLQLTCNEDPRTSADGLLGTIFWWRFHWFGYGVRYIRYFFDRSDQDSNYVSVSSSILGMIGEKLVAGDALLYLVINDENGEVLSDRVVEIIRESGKLLLFGKGADSVLIDKLAQAGIKVGVWTGDKMKTEITIGFVCSWLRQGITKEELIDCLGTMAQSGTSKYLKALKENEDHGADNGLIGQFGNGFYSVFLVSQKDVVSTKSPRSDRQYVGEAEADSSSYVIKEETYPEKLLCRGTQVTPYLREDDKYEFSDPTRIQNLVKNYSQFVAFPIYMCFEGDMNHKHHSKQFRLLLYEDDCDITQRDLDVVEAVSQPGLTKGDPRSCGADLKIPSTEAVNSAFHGVHPQVCSNDDKILLCVELVKAEKFGYFVWIQGDAFFFGIAGGAWKPFPERLNVVPFTISSGFISGISVGAYQEDNRMSKKHVTVFRAVNKIIDSGRFRDQMDMTAGCGFVLIVNVLSEFRRSYGRGFVQSSFHWFPP